MTISSFSRTLPLLKQCTFIPPRPTRALAMSANGMNRPCSETHPLVLGADDRRSMNHGPQSDRSSGEEGRQNRQEQLPPHRPGWPLRVTCESKMRVGPTTAFSSVSGHCEWLQRTAVFGRRLPFAGIAEAIDCVTATKGWSRPKSVIQVR